MEFSDDEFRKVTTGRRVSSRLRVRLPATLTTMSGVMNVVLENLSEHGARIKFGANRSESIRVGGEGVLQWHRFDVFCTIRWIGADGCGLQFDEPISRRELIFTRTLDEREHLPGEREMLRGIARNFVSGR